MWRPPVWLPWEVRPWWPRTGQHSREPMHSAQGPQNHRDTQGCSFLQQCGGYRSWCQEGETASLWPCHGEDGDTRYGIRTTGSGGDLELPFCRVPSRERGCTAGPRWAGGRKTSPGLASGAGTQAAGELGPLSLMPVSYKLQLTLPLKIGRPLTAPCLARPSLSV